MGARFSLDMKEQELYSERNVEMGKALRKELSQLSFARLRDLSPVCLYSVGSTQDYLKNEFNSIHEGDFVVSQIQTEGRGREGRSWHSDQGGLYLSLRLTPERLEIMDKLALMASTAIKNTLEADASLSPCSIKQPNDVIYRGKKIAGVLIDAELRGKNAVACLGIGVDLNNGANWNQELRDIATSYFLETGEEISLTQFIVKLLLRLDHEYAQLLGL